MTGPSVAICAQSSTASKMAPKRSRSEITPQALAEALLPSVRTMGAAFLDFDESESVKKVKFTAEAVLAGACVVAPIRQHSATLVLKKTTVAAALQIVLKEVKLPLAPDHLQDWLETMNRRVRNICAVIHNAETKGKRPSWVARLPWAAQAEPAATVAVDSPSSQSADEVEVGSSGVAGDAGAEKESAGGGEGQVFKFGFDPSLRLAWRIPVGGTSKDKELSAPLTAEPEDHDDDLVLASFADGTSWAISNFTVGDLRDKTTARSGGSGVSKLWTGTRASTHHELALQQRVDRCLLIALYEQGAQVCQFRADAFGKLPPGKQNSLPPGHPLLDRVKEVVVPLCERYASGEIASVGDLKAARNELLDSLNPTRPGRRPAQVKGEETAAGKTGVKDSGNSDSTRLGSSEVAGPSAKVPTSASSGSKSARGSGASTSGAQVARLGLQPRQNNAK